MNPHWSNLWHRGSILLRNDSAMNLSPELYREFSVPYDALLLERFGGGAVHFCGRGDHYIAALSEIKGLYGVQMTQPSYNDMEVIYRHTVDKGIKLLAFDRARAEQDSVRNGAFSHHISV
jgi:uroporphyrinogen-III decarboxylase